MIGISVLEERKSKFNGNLRVVRSWGMGTYIQADGLTQSGGVVETIWKQTLNKIKKEKFENVLILGLGGGTVAKLIHKNWPEAKITGADIDPIMVELGKKYLGLDKYNVKIKITDASNIPNFPNKKYDLIIVDLYQGDKYPKKFEDYKFLEFARSHLANNGITVFNRLYYKENKVLAEEFGNKLQKVFKKVNYFYPVANLMFICSN